MASVYANLVFHGLKTLDEVPKSLRLAVETLLQKMNN